MYVSMFVCMSGIWVMSVFCKFLHCNHIMSGWSAVWDSVAVSLRLLNVRSPHSLSYTTSVCHAVLKRLFPTNNWHGHIQGKACWHFLHSITSHQTLFIHVQPSPGVAFDTINVDWRNGQIEVMTVNLHRCLTSFRSLWCHWGTIMTRD